MLPNDRWSGPWIKLSNVLCSATRHLTFMVPLSSQVNKWVLTNWIVEDTSKIMYGVGWSLMREEKKSFDCYYWPKEHTDVYDYLNMKSSGHLIAALGLHGFNFSAMKGMKGQVLDFIILLQEKQNQHEPKTYMSPHRKAHSWKHILPFWRRNGLPDDLEPWD